MVQSSISQQNIVFHDAADRRAVSVGGTCWYHCTAFMDYQAAQKGKEITLELKKYY